ncbi:Stc1 domain-containing protein, partial [Morchella snyderi]
DRDGGAPSLIRCAICKKPKSRDEFSKRQLLKFTAYNKGGRTMHATCSQCTANQNYELKCCVCDKVKGLDLFAKSQRKDPDNARCTKCVDNDNKPTAWSSAAGEDDEDEFE